MLDAATVIIASLAYLGMLFGIAFYGDRRAAAGRSLTRNPAIYTLSLAVYCTAWTFYGAVGTAARSGLEYITIYTGPTIVFLGWWFVLRKIARISKGQRITSIADFIASRYGKSARLGMIVTLIAIFGTMPYIALQLKAVTTSFIVLVGYEGGGASSRPVALLSDIAFLTAMGMGVFAILFGTRHIDPDEHHEGVVAAIAFESCVKLIALLAVGLFALYLVGASTTAESRAAAVQHLTTLPDGYGARWLTMTFLSMSAVICLPRQFHMTIVENVDERHLSTAAWLFPLYLFLMSLLALPIAIAGRTILPATENPDFFVLTVPMMQGQDALALLAFIGGLSSATSMVIVSGIALTTMLCNDLVMPALLRLPGLRLTERGDLTGLLLTIRRLGVLAIMLLGYVYYRAAGEAGPLANIGLASFAAVAQFAPVILGALFWKGGTCTGAQTGLLLGIALWAYTLVLPLFAEAGILGAGIVENGPWGLHILKPQALFGLQGWGPLAHALFWSITANVTGFVSVSLFSRQDALERIQAALFVDVFRRPHGEEPQVWRRSARWADLYALLQRFLGRERALKTVLRYAEERGVTSDLQEADAELLAFAERLLAGRVGAASARVIVSSICKGEQLRLDEVLAIVEETHQIITHSRELEQKSQELQATAEELRIANERLKELDRLKDDFLTTVSHELRTPLTSIRSFSEILVENTRLDRSRSDHFLAVIASESQRLTRLLDSILDLARLERGGAEWRMEDVDPAGALNDALASMLPLFYQAGVQLEARVEPCTECLWADRDRLVQVFLNLFSNALKFCDQEHGAVTVVGRPGVEGYFASVSDNGRGVALEDQALIFERFAKGRDAAKRELPGSGLGLAIARHIVGHHGGKIWLRSPPGEGATFCIFLPNRRPRETETASL